VNDWISGTEHSREEHPVFKVMEGNPDTYTWEKYVKSITTESPMLNVPSPVDAEIDFSFGAFLPFKVIVD
jgi:hypothetical protein